MFSVVEQALAVPVRGRTGVRSACNLRIMGTCCMALVLPQYGHVASESQRFQVARLDVATRQFPV